MVDEKLENQRVNQTHRLYIYALVHIDVHPH